MTAFDTDVLTQVLRANPVYVARATAIPRADQAIPVVVVEEVLRGRLNAIRQADAGKGSQNLERAYDLLRRSLLDLAALRILPYTAAADALVLAWRAAKVRVGTRDLRIAAICIAHRATLATRNARDYARLTGLTFDVWA